jgi:FdhD protein
VADTHKAIVSRPVLHVDVKRDDASDARRLDEVAVEAPLEIRLAGDTLAITMRTPGEDRQLALGFLLSEGIITGRDDVGHAYHCGRPGEEGYGNTIDVLPGPGVALDPERSQLSRRGTITSAACGTCGRLSIDDLLERCGPLPLGPPLPLSLLISSGVALRAHQPCFARTGGLHAAAVLDQEGRVLAASEDIGRHNAVDKVIGTLLLLDSVPVQAAEPSDAAPCVLVVSGRVSFEIVQKAAVARLAVVCGVSAPTSLAIDLAERCGIALACFVRGESLNLYTHEERVML